jgi:hypothetical protein
VSVSFTPWVCWANRNKLPDKNKSGVYLIGRFEQKPSPGPADPSEGSIVYIGESSDGTFQSRWRSFDRASFKAKGRHRGGKRYKEKFGGDSSVLYVSILSVSSLMKAFLGLDTCSFLGIGTESAKVHLTDEVLEEVDDLLIKYVERRLIFLYSITHGHRPACNGD